MLSLRTFQTDDALQIVMFASSLVRMIKCACSLHHFHVSLIIHQSIYVFNKHYLDYDLDDVLRDLRVEAPLQPPIEGK